MSEDNQDPSKLEAAILSHILNLQARIDALTAMVWTLAKKEDVSREKFQAALKKAHDGCLQKRLERLEGQNPLMAALADSRKEFPDIDQKFLDGLKFDDNP